MAVVVAISGSPSPTSRTARVLANVAGPRKRTTVKQKPYESGMDTVGDARQPFDMRFYVVAILFLVFDVELVAVK